MIFSHPFNRYLITLTLFLKLLNKDGNNNSNNSILFLFDLEITDTRQLTLNNVHDKYV